MKLLPLAVCLALLTYACAPAAEPLDLDPGWQESDDSSMRPQRSGDAGVGARADATVGTSDAGSAGSTHDAAAPATDAPSALPSSDAAANARDADASGSASDAGAASADANGQSGTDDAGSTPPVPKSGVVVGYYPAWATYDRNYQVAQIPGAKLTHINYAFANIQNGRCVLGDAWADVQKTFSGDTWDESSANKAGNLKQLRTLKQANPALRTLISIGGWTWSTHFSDAAASDAARKTFASSCVDFMVEHGFDGVDIDWEYPVGEASRGTRRGPKTRPTTRCF